jgi:hypothetical protein
MASKFTELIVDANDPRRLADFWCDVLGYEITEADDDGVEIAPHGHDGSAPGPQPPTIVFVPVPEAKTLKNRLHIDVNAFDRDQDGEVARLLELGATRVDVGQGEQSWVVLADLEGNEFCVLGSRRP